MNTLKDTILGAGFLALVILFAIAFGLFSAPEGEPVPHHPSAHGRGVMYWLELAGIIGAVVASAIYLS